MREGEGVNIVKFIDMKNKFNVVFSLAFLTFTSELEKSIFSLSLSLVYFLLLAMQYAHIFLSHLLAICCTLLIWEIAYKAPSSFVSIVHSLSLSVILNFYPFLCRFEKYISGKYLGEVSFTLLKATINFKFTLLTFSFHILRHPPPARFVVLSCETCVTRVCCLRKRQKSSFRHHGNLAPTMYHTLKSEYNGNLFQFFLPLRFCLHSNVSVRERVWRTRNMYGLSCCRQ